jgi:Tfp pilus assembly protein FimV
MERLGLVAATFGARGWRPYAGPVAFLLAATVAIGFARVELRGHARAAAPPVRHAVHKAPAHRRGHALYVVRAGDTLFGISSKTGVPTAKLVALNPKVSPTALFIGEQIHLR